ncbi:uncharacterized protein N7479_005469 [Penicillium vulpinum]|uniref:C2H2-type domain-containing protein n=1 Tax=Penicillium vulpinum TaxID=29845 RepID=A0A1V6SF52_9EURO|nr:uncharacterized protein N7479_005469 [Penicillium vulpinum]KAJ5958319.1 hypothetical protein N7479_005469 [Penicillium vulpinum]OQE12213.1 hypothetical protein PENVUL_c001G01717 [Penicillium vulpinum]
MSVSQIRVMPSYQPFQCLVCQSRFTRHENLKRHSTLHSRSQAEASLPCDFCHATFSRPDLRNRHMKRKHPEHEQHRVTKRTQRQPAPRQATLHSSVSPTAISPTGSHNVLPSPGSVHSSPGEETRFDSDAIWRPVMRYQQQQQQQFDRRHPRENPNIATPRNGGAKTQQITRDLLQHQPTSDSVLIDQIVQDATDLERNLLLGASFLKPTNHLDNQLHPMATSQAEPLDTTLVEYSFNHPILDRLSPGDIPQLQDDWIPTALQISRGCNLFFNSVSDFLPFLHSPTFDPTQAPPHLVLSMLCLAYQYGEDPECGDQEGSGQSFSIRCFHKARALLASDEERPDASAMITALVQSYLLLQICAMMYLCGDNSACGLKMHSHMISLARAGRMTQPMPVESGATTDLESLWREFIKAESHKRTLFAVHQIDALWYQFLSIPRSISHLEIKHEMPCPEDQWISSSSAEWAHRQLVARHAGPSVTYTDAVRRFLSSDEDITSLPTFDPYGAINIAQFLISSAREISGWSTMTGMLSMERFGALRSSLITLSPFICPNNHTALTKHATSCAATWETAMIELQMWSPSHTGGIVEGSIDAVLSQSTYLGPSQFLCDASTAKAIQPHVNWFLRYLNETLILESEAPWVALYAYKAFLIAWQLIHVGIPGAMDAVGVHDGDMEGALMWARKVFQRRQKWQLGKLILSCLDELEK